MTSWDDEAERWVLWARTPGHDAYWHYRDSFFDGLVPVPGRCTLEVGCGEGRVARDLAERGHRVVGVDSSPTLLRYARQASPAGRFVLADAAELPFPASSFDLVVAYNSLMDVEDMAATVREAARVLDPGGRFCLSVTHPLADAGTFASEHAEAEFTIGGSYLERNRFDGTDEREGLTMTFRGWTYPLEDYADALERASLLIEAVREPKPVPVTAYYERWMRIPMFLQIRARKERD